MLIRVQVLIPDDILLQARLAAANRNLSFSKLVTHSLTKEVKPIKKMSIYKALRTVAKLVGKKKVKLPPDFATNDKYLYTYP